MENLNKCNGLIITDYMKSAKISDILKIWKQIYRVDWKKIKTREGDKKDEYLLSPHELKSAYFISLNKTKLIAIDKSKNNLKIFKKNITSENSLKLTNKEIMNLIKIKPKLK